VRIGTIVRVPLRSGRARGWVVDLDPPAGEDVALREVLEVVSLGPPPAVVELARFAAWRYAGRLRPLLVAASPERVVRALPAQASARPSSSSAPEAELADAFARALRAGRAVLRLPPAAPRVGLVTAAHAAWRERGDLVVLCPERRDVAALGQALRRRGIEVAALPEDWALAAAGGRVVVGTRQAVLAPVERLGGILVLDAHAQAYAEQRAPTWNATVLAARRAEAAGAGLLLVSPTPPLEQLAEHPLVTVSRRAERAGWPPVEVLDRRQDDPRSGLYAPRLASIVRFARRAEPALPVVCVLNRTGRARLLACAACGALATCEACSGALEEARARPAPLEAALSCPRCGRARPAVCAACGAGRLRTLRQGVARAAEELAALVGEPAVEVSSAAQPLERAAPAGLLVGTEAVLHRVRAASLVVYLDFDQELLAPRLRASEQALALLALGARLVGARRAPAAGGRAPGRLVVQTRLAAHEVVRAAVHADPGLLAGPELARRELLELPPARALAVVGGEGASEVLPRLSADGDVEVAPLAGGRHLVRARDARRLADALAAAGLPAPKVRVEVDPVRI